MNHNVCPLCLSSFEKCHFFWKQTIFSRKFYKCSICDLIFVGRNKVLSLEQQKLQYDFHQNNQRTDGYIKFLNRIVQPVIARVAFNARGLDFGSGPYPMLAELLRESGYAKINVYDPIYKIDPDVLLKKYHFITLCEVVEHLIDPRLVFDQLDKILHPGGLLIISTGFRVADDHFFNWYYNQDETHINYFSLKTLCFIKDDLNYEWVERGKDLVIFLKK